MHDDRHLVFNLMFTRLLRAIVTVNCTSEQNNMILLKDKGYQWRANSHPVEKVNLNTRSEGVRNIYIALERLIITRIIPLRSLQENLQKVLAKIRLGIQIK